MVEIELSVLVWQCLKERIGNLEALKHQIEVWQHQRNRQHATVQWRFTTQDARVKLQRLYPSFDPA